MGKTLVFGASLHSYRYSNLAMRRLLDHGFEIVAIGGTKGKFHDIEIQTGHPPLSDIHTITMYLNPAKQPAHFDYLIGLNPERIIFNPGSENAELARLAKEAGIMVEYACTLVLLSMGTYLVAA